MAAALQFVSLANAVAGLFGGGPSLVDLLNLQSETLQNIQRQLGVIQDGIQRLSLRLEDVRRLVQATPQLTVQAITRSNIWGLRGVYEQHMFGYTRVLAQDGIIAARAFALHRLMREVIPKAPALRDRSLTQLRPCRRKERCVSVWSVGLLSG